MLKNSWDKFWKNFGKKKTLQNKKERKVTQDGRNLTELSRPALQVCVVCDCCENKREWRW